MDQTRRRRGSTLEEAIVEAAWDELREAGYAKATMNNIARRAGTSKHVLYRRWKNQPELFLAALKRFAATADVPDTGDVRDDLAALLGRIRQVFDLLPGDLISGLITDSRNDAALFDEVRTYVMGEGVHDVTRVILRRAADRGQIEPGLPAARILRLPIDLLRNEYLMSRGPLPAETVTEIIDDIVMPLLRPAARR
ncbi:TetR/AcrR family transcriptional regulator [Nonomuraea sp. KC401]|uniref:TetR/AcrR family transcriptional regulator n=1 Tax=unclassified Nonomuraea TaxID=2593643 RepID=UPI0010FE8976|nr:MULTISPECIES: TetR/AcrR family transcriptional regulator [unclassified Nonomuraea]NBE95866.1 TetR family transcriptional regulator [Nonomuraea sp. K271]TLF72002.1 TetR/AcrR family transcriptional regulator [Nonomuraea sp. KC401]